ncbi:MAG: hypothetical protein AAFQ28_14145, partial [Pseudomonadota bacterium]
MVKNVRYSLKVLTGSNSNLTVPLGLAPVTVGSGRQDAVRVSDHGILPEHLKVFPNLDETDPDSEPEGWGFAYVSGVQISNSVNNARFGTIDEGMTFDIGETRLEVIVTSRDTMMSNMGTVSKPSGTVTAVILGLFMVLTFGYVGWFYYQQSQVTKPRPGYIEIAQLLRAADGRIEPVIDKCLSAPINLSEDEEVHQVATDPSYTFVLLREALDGSSQQSELRQTFVRDLNDRFQRAVLLHTTRNFE